MANAADDLPVELEKRGEAVVLRPSGEIDLGRSPSLRTSISKAQSAKPQRLIFDLKDVPYMDSSGVATLVEAMQVARRYHGSVVLCGLHERVLSIFEIARLDMVFKIVDTLDEALHA